MIVLAFESSCDESSVALIRDGQVAALQTVTQSVHEKFGGVVPELAGRSHLELLDRLTANALQEASIVLADIDIVAATVGPGLVGSLLVGSNYARGLSLALQKPFCPVHHLEAHLWSAELDRRELPLPFLVLLVSGGHTMLVLVEGLRAYCVLGSTLDDALGEAYDKVGKLVGLGFPAGAAVDKLASSGNPLAFPLTSPMADASLDFSFSGLKTAVLYAMRGRTAADLSHSDLLASFQEAALKSVTGKVERALAATSAQAVVAAGGVAANSRLRELLAGVAAEHNISHYFPSMKYCMDNAAMIGYLAWKLASAGIHDLDAPVRPRWPLDALAKETEAA